MAQSLRSFTYTGTSPFWSRREANVWRQIMEVHLPTRRRSFNNPRKNAKPTPQFRPWKGLPLTVAEDPGWNAGVPDRARPASNLPIQPARPLRVGRQLSERGRHGGSLSALGGRQPAVGEIAALLSQNRP